MSKYEKSLFEVFRELKQRYGQDYVYEKMLIYIQRINCEKRMYLSKCRGF